MLFRCEARDMFLSPAMMIEFSFLDELFFFSKGMNNPDFWI